MKRRKSKASTGHETWTPKSPPTPYRPQIKGGVPFPPERPADEWINPVKGVKATRVNKQAR
jgi:hypothetical protein